MKKLIMITFENNQHLIIQIKLKKRRICLCNNISDLLQAYIYDEDRDDYVWKDTKKLKITKDGFFYKKKDQTKKNFILCGVCVFNNENDKLNPNIVLNSEQDYCLQLDLYGDSSILSQIKNENSPLEDIIQTITENGICINTSLIINDDKQNWEEKYLIYRRLDFKKLDTITRSRSFSDFLSPTRNLIEYE